MLLGDWPAATGPKEGEGAHDKSLIAQSSMTQSSVTSTTSSTRQWNLTWHLTWRSNLATWRIFQPGNLTKSRMHLNRGGLTMDNSEVIWGCQNFLEFLNIFYKIYLELCRNNLSVFSFSNFMNPRAAFIAGSRSSFSFARPVAGAF